MLGPDLGAAVLMSTAYLTQVREFIAPVNGLRDRDVELGDLAAFCGGNEPYLWWRGGPWAGKSALLSWFALHPPENVTVVCFFITDRLAAQADHFAFTDAVLEQLAVLVPAARAAVATATVGRRDRLRMELLERAATRAERDGRRLVLLVDGLDEDQGAPSIASLLPRRPVPGLRVVVASRPDPLVALEFDHPLNSCARRILSPSPWARDVQNRAEYELGNLLRNPDIPRNVIGLVTAANGLTGTELAELTDLAPFEIDALVAGVSGRAFRSRTLPGATEPVYVLAHETLQRTAERKLGTALIARYRNEIHAWAAGYRERRWPAETPGFLLRGYFAMAAKDRDTPLLAALALDVDRHERMLTLIGGDIAALNEIHAVQELVLEDPDPDLLTMYRLARHRDSLTERNRYISSDVPVAWARLGEFDRAETLARSISDSGTRAQALRELVGELATVGEFDRAETLARNLGDPDWVPVWARDEQKSPAAGRSSERADAWALVQLVGPLAIAGEFDRAQAIAADMPSAGMAAQALCELVGPLAAAGQYDRAEALARSIDDPDDRALAFSTLIRPLAAVGEMDRVRAIAELVVPVSDNRELRARDLTWLFGPLIAAEEYDRAETLVRSMTDSRELVRASTRLIGCLIEAGQGDRARAIAWTTTDAVRDIADLGPEWVLTDLIVMLVTAREFDRATTIALAATNFRTDHRVWALIELLGRLIEIGEADRARPIADRIRKIVRGAETTARRHRDAQALTELTWPLIAVGERDRALRAARAAETAAQAISDSETRAQVLADLVGPLAAVRDYAHAEALVRSITEARERARALKDLLRDLLEAGEFDRAESLARNIGDPGERASALSELLGPLNNVGQHDRVRSIAEAVAHGIPDPTERTRAIDALIGPLVAIAEFDRAETLARSMTDPHQQALALSRLVEPLTAAGQLARAHSISQTIESLARSIPEPESREYTLDQLVQTLVRAGEYDRAETTAHAIADPWWRAAALTELLVPLELAGQHDRVRAIAAAATSAARDVDNPWQQAQALIRLVGPIAAVGEFNQAEALAHSVGDPERDLQWAREDLIPPPPAPGDREESMALARMVGPLAAAGEIDRAQALVESITDLEQRTRAVRELVGPLAAAGEVGRAEYLARSIDGAGERALALCHLIEPLAAADERDRANAITDMVERLAHTIDDPSECSRVLQQLVASLIAINEYERAESVAHRIPVPDIEASALIDIASGGASRTVARRLIAEAWYLAEWTAPLRALAAADPSTLLAIAREI